MILTQAELDEFTCDCGNEDCAGGLVIHAACHIDSPTWSIYYKETGFLEVKCSQCKNTVVVIKVAEE